MKCLWHCCQNEVIGTKKIKFCCKKCKNKYYVDKRRKKIKEMAVEYKGGKCSKCNYNKCIDALEFHHINPDSKDFALSKNGHSRSWERTRKELDKCIIVCSNCHREIHHEIDKKKRQ